MSDRTRTPPETPTAKLQRPAPTGYRDEAGRYHPAPDTPAFVEHVTTCEPCKKHLGQPYTWSYGRPPSTGHVFNFVRSIQDPDGVPTVPIDPATCPHCNHQHTGVEAAYICIGCPCEYRPCHGSGQHTRAVRTGEVQDHGHGSEPVFLSHCLFCDKPFPPSEKMPRHWMIPWTDEDVASVTFKDSGKVIEGIEPGMPPFTLTDNAGAVTLLDKCDGEHPMPACKDPGCWHAEPPTGHASVLVRYVGPHAELLCELCELPLNSEPITLVEITDEEPASGEDDAEFHVWHLACARKEAEAQEGVP